jgi:phosphopantothenoylcysteine decarboxylase/phosphopantothenate--cysteine ligase
MNFLIAVSGSIAAYKSPDICRGLINQGHKVKVVLSEGALKFVSPDIFKHLGVESTYLPKDDFNHSNVLHIELSKWLDTFVLVPASANTLSKLAHGGCDDLLSSIFLSLEPQKVKVIYPAMNTFMYRNIITQSNFKILKSLPNMFMMAPDSGVLACGDVGEGKLADVKSIIEMLPTYSNKQIQKSVLITAGATMSSIDTVRYVTNPARGGTAYLLAKKYLAEGYTVHVVQGQDVMAEFSYLKKHPKYSFEIISTTKELLESVKFRVADVDIYISPMAVSDIEFEFQDKKIKKLSMKGSFAFTSAPDVLKYVVENKKQGQQIVGFAAESDLSESVIQEKITRKPVDLLVANLVDSGFGTSSGHYKLVSNGKTKEYPVLDKKELVELIFRQVR